MTTLIESIYFLDGLEFTRQDGILLYLIAGNITLLSMVRLARQDPLDYEDLSHRLGWAVLYGVLGWPVVCVLWVFSWDCWMSPVGRRS